MENPHLFVVSVLVISLVFGEVSWLMIAAACFSCVRKCQVIFYFFLTRRKKGYDDGLVMRSD
jgi:hypothetical protein